jgi:hypothetical protein
VQLRKQALNLRRPGSFLAGEKGPSGDEHRYLCRPPGAVERLLRERRFGAEHRVGGGLYIADSLNDEHRTPREGQSERERHVSPPERRIRRPP